MIWSKAKALGGPSAAVSCIGLFSGETGVGKSVVARALLEDLSKTNNYLPVYMNFSAHTSSNRIQDLIEAKLERKRKNCIGAMEQVFIMECLTSLLIFSVQINRVIF